jgi:hypothetical protein
MLFPGYSFLLFLTLILSLGVSTVKINFWNLSRLSLLLRQDYFFFLVKIFKIETFQSRLSCVKIFIKTVKICQDFSRFIKISQHYRDFLRYFRPKILTNLEISIKKYNTIDLLSLKIQLNCQDLPKISCLDRFLDLDPDFWDWKVVSRQNWDFSISIETSFLKLSRFSRPSRLTFCQCRDRESRSRPPRLTLN